MSLIQAYFPDAMEDKHAEMLARLLATGRGKKIMATTALREVLQCADLEDADDDLRDLRDKLQDQDREDLILQRMKHAKAAASFATPNVLKNLRPPAPGCTLTFQYSESSFQGYYRRNLTEAQLKNKRVKRLWSTASNFGVKRTQLAALRMVVNFLWAKHGQSGKDWTES